jgi:Fe-S cluster assembly iron-binding protein IscA
LDVEVEVEVEVEVVVDELKVIVMFGIEIDYMKDVESV